MQEPTPVVYVLTNDSVQPEVVTVPFVKDSVVALVLPPIPVKAACVVTPAGNAALHGVTFNVGGQVKDAADEGLIVLVAESE